jgi:predicted ATP-grasp superfamily ATP-dependent carboligase
VLGGDYRALGVVRSLGRHGIPVWVVRAPDDHRLAGLSRYSQREVFCPSDDDADRLRYLAELSRRHRLHGWVLFPTADASAAFVARQHAALSESYRPTTPPWDVYRWGYDKRCTAELARSAGIAYPRTVVVPTREDARRYAGDFPVILKPATKPSLNRPSVKAWPAEDTASLLRSYDVATAETDPETLLLQELIPGVRHVQYSFAALCVEGRAVASVTAERVRQHPPDFGRSSTFVITIDEPAVERAARRVLEELRLTGLAEVEFKKDPRDGSLRLLDINVRVWGWHTIARRAGLDFPYLAWRLAVGHPVEDARAPVGLRWLRLTTDAAAGLREIESGQLSARAYLNSVRRPHERAVAAADDPLPGLAEVPLFVHEVGWAGLSRQVREVLAPHALGPGSGCAGPRAGPRELPADARGNPLSVSNPDRRPRPTNPAEVST